MASLSKNGTEVRRLRRALPADELIASGFVEVSIRSNVWVLRRQVVVFKSDGRRHDYGWKRWYKMPLRDTVSMHVESLERRGFVIVEDKS